MSELERFLPMKRHEAMISGASVESETFIGRSVLDRFSPTGLTSAWELSKFSNSVVRRLRDDMRNPPT